MSETIGEQLQTPEDAVAMRRAVDSNGRCYSELRPLWRPRLGIAYRDLALGWAVLIGVVVGLVWIQSRSVTLAWLTVPVAALSVGGALHHLYLFLHEASHYNLARERSHNDRLANLLLAPVLGQSVGQYRSIHFDHHRLLGTPDDPEHSYFEPLTPGSLLRSLMGVTLVRAAFRRIQGGAGQSGASDYRVVLAAALLHGTLVLAALTSGFFPLAAAWIGGVLVVFPFLSTVRQTLEHRGEGARVDVDYASVPHGETNRIFGDGIMSAMLGGAGFNRHLLHHWDPQLSYTRLRDLEAFLLETELAASVEDSRTTYGRAFSSLFVRHG